MKMIVETTGSFMLMGSAMNGADRVEFDRPCVVLATTYIQLKAAAGALNILKQGLPDSASDEDFAEYLASAKGDAALAIESYAASLDVGPDETAAEKRARVKAESKAADDAKLALAEKNRIKIGEGQ
jgi:hypothetical protein